MGFSDKFDIGTALKLSPAAAAALTLAACEPQNPPGGDVEAETEKSGARVEMIIVPKEGGDIGDLFEEQVFRELSAEMAKEKSMLLQAYGDNLNDVQKEQLWSIYISLADFIAENDGDITLTPRQGALIAAMQMYEDSVSREPIFNDEIRSQFDSVRLLKNKLKNQGWNPWEVNKDVYFERQED